MQALSLQDCPQVTDAILKILASGCRSLTNLNLAGCNEITDEGIKALASGCQDEQPEFVQRGKQHFAIFKFNNTDPAFSTAVDDPTESILLADVGRNAGGSQAS
jgi:hypothetical protein